MLINHTYFAANRAAHNSPQMTGCFSTLNPSTECWKIWVQASYITFVSWLSRYWWTAACATLTGLATETNCGSNSRTCRLPCITESRPTWDQKEDRLETDGGNSGDCWEHLFKCQISMPLKNGFAKKETIKNIKIAPVRTGSASFLAAGAALLLL